MSGLYASTTMPWRAQTRARVPLLEEWVNLDLVHRGDDFRLRQELVEMARHEVADADGPCAPFAVDALERPPGIEPLARHRPVDEVEVDIIEAEPGQAGVERAQRAVVALIVVPELGGDEYVRARHAALPQPLAHVVLVAVDAGGVDVAVAEPQRRRYSAFASLLPEAPAKRRGRPAEWAPRY